MQLLQCGGLKDKRILLIEQDAKTLNDRTWCFWDKENNYDHLVSSEWKAAWFKNENYEKKLANRPMFALWWSKHGLFFAYKK